MSISKNWHLEITPMASWAMGKKVFIPIVISALIFGATLVRVPFYPVPFTLQTFVLPLICLFSTRKYVLQGLALFTVSRIIQSGFGLLLTSGYIMGFFAVAIILTAKAPPKNNLKLFCKIFGAQIIVLLSGTIVLSMFIGLQRAFLCGFLFFIAAEVLKTIIIVGFYNLIAARFKAFPVER
ncbi:MAG: biotin transporter BioY [Puniceicoccales bacterium]|jgi:biotin transport system substrate-specific component|nr:biotin transporter BioY [Puniceicoccales bacterium]